MDALVPDFLTEWVCSVIKEIKCSKHYSEHLSFSSFFFTFKTAKKTDVVEPPE